MNWICLIQSCEAESFNHLPIMMEIICEEKKELSEE